MATAQTQINVPTSMTDMASMPCGRKIIGPTPHAAPANSACTEKTACAQGGRTPVSAARLYQAHIR